MVMKSSPFVTSNFEDKYYSRLISPDTNNFWKIFEKDIKVGSEFKGKIN